MYTSWWQRSRAERVCPGQPKRGLQRNPGGHRRRWSWYRYQGRLSCSQLWHGSYHWRWELLHHIILLLLVLFILLNHTNTLSLCFSWFLMLYYQWYNKMILLPFLWNFYIEGENCYIPYFNDLYYYAEWTINLKHHFTFLNISSYQIHLYHWLINDSSSI